MRERERGGERRKRERKVDDVSMDRQVRGEGEIEKRRGRIIPCGRS